MDQFIEQRRRSGAGLAPLPSLDDVATFADASLQCPEGLAGRAERLAEVMTRGGVSCNERQACWKREREVGGSCCVASVADRL